MKRPVYLGELYKESFDELNKQIEGCFENGPGDLPLQAREKEVKGIIVPCGHYGIVGKIAAWAYKELAESKFPEIFIIIGDAEEGDKAYVSLEDFQTPLGVIKNSRLSSNTGDIILDEEKHLKDKTIELQLPFLQFISKDRLERLRILPLLVGGCDYEAIKRIAKAIKGINKSYAIIVSANLTRYGVKYNYTPFRFNIQEEVKGVDNKAIELIKNLNTLEFLQHCERFKIKSGAIGVLLEVLKEGEGTLLMYENSGEVTQDYENFMTYGSFVF